MLQRCLKVCAHQSLKIRVGDISGGDQKQFVRFPGNQIGLDEIGVLGDDDSLFPHGQPGQVSVGGAIAKREVERMQGIVPRFSQPYGETPWKLGVDQELHAASESIRLTWDSRAANASAARMSSRSRSS